MSWIAEGVKYSWLESLLLNVVKCGPIPAHVAFIMDGNRRFARINGIQKVEGHTQGFDKLAETLQWCKDLGITEVTVYAFSIENFKRSPAEVEDLLQLARDKFRRLLDESDRLREHGVKVRVIGRRDLLPEDLQELIGRAEAATAGNSQRTLNVAFAYTSREEMAHSVRAAAEAARDGLLDPEGITERTVEDGLYNPSRVDLLIRTSGEVRLSDFLLWQSSQSVTIFSEVLWPDFSLKNLLWAVFHYQRNLPRIREACAGGCGS